MVADHLVLRLRLLQQPGREPLVQVRAAALGQPAVGDVADQRVREAERVLARVDRPLGLDQLAASERGQRWGERIGAHERGHGAAMEAAALDRRMLEQRALLRVERLEPRGEHRLDGRRQPIAADRHQLLEEQRVALRARDDALGGVRLGAERPGQRERVVVGERVEPEHPELRCGAAHAGRAASSSGRARQTSRIGASLEKPTM